MHAIHSAPHRAFARLLIGGVLLAGACSRRSANRLLADGPETGPFEGGQVDVRPKLLGCEAPFLLASVGVRSAGSAGAMPVSLLVDAVGRVVPGSVGQRRGAEANRPPLPVGMEQAILTCRYSPGARRGQPVAVWTTSVFNPP